MHQFSASAVDLLFELSSTTVSIFTGAGEGLSALLNETTAVAEVRERYKLSNQLRIHRLEIC